MDNDLVNGWYKCIKDSDNFTNGDFYYFQNGSTKDDEGNQRPHSTVCPQRYNDLDSEQWFHWAGLVPADENEVRENRKEETKMQENRSGRYPWVVEGVYVCRANSQLVSGEQLVPDDFTVGKEYTFVNGKVLDDKGCSRPLGTNGIPVPVIIHDDPKNDDWTATWFRNHKFEKVTPFDKDLLKKLLKALAECRGTPCSKCKVHTEILAANNTANCGSCVDVLANWARELLETLEPKPDSLEKWKSRLPSEAYDILKEVIKSNSKRKITICFKQPHLKTWRVGVLKGFNPENGELDVDIRGDKSLKTVRIEQISDLQRWKGGLCGQVVSLQTVQPLVQGRVYGIRNGKVVVPVNSDSSEAQLFPMIGYIRSEEDEYFKDNFVLVSGEQEIDVFEHAIKSPELANGLAVYMLQDEPGGITYGGTYKFVNGYFTDDEGCPRPLVGGGLYINADCHQNSIENYGFSMVKTDAPHDPNLLNGRAIQVTPAPNRTVGRIYRIKNGEIVNDDMKIEKLGKMLRDRLKVRHGLLMLDESGD